MELDMNTITDSEEMTIWIGLALEKFKVLLNYGPQEIEEYEKHIEHNITLYRFEFCAYWMQD
jgi:hypothetical protein